MTAGTCLLYYEWSITGSKTRSIHHAVFGGGEACGSRKRKQCEFGDGPIQVECIQFVEISFIFNSAQLMLKIC